MSERIAKWIISILCICLGLPLHTAVSAEENLDGGWDVVVIGGGLMGSSTAWQLAIEGQGVLLLEMQGETYTQGSSFGDARISRSLGPPDDIWGYMHNRTVAEMKELIAFLNEHGDKVSMDDVYVTSPVNYVDHISRLEDRSWLSEQPDPVKVATTPDEARTVFGINLAEDAYIVREYKDYSGTINPGATIRALHRGTVLAGGRVAYRQRVTSLIRDNAGFELEITDVDSGLVRQLTVPRVVSAAGPYTGSLLKDVALEFDQLITPRRVFLAFFEVAPDFWNGLLPTEQQGLKDLFPAINSTLQLRASDQFSMIERYTERGTPIIKIGGHFRRTDIEDLGAVWQQSLSDEEIEWSYEMLLHHLALLDVGFTRDHLLVNDGYSCVYSLTESEVPYVTNALLPDGSPDPDLVVVGGMSGVGAKGSLGYGVIAADLLSGRTEQDPVYLAAREAFGFERMKRDTNSLGN
ncbi:MAG: FAD-dependent oxidoreductase [Woeseiaceae bacterium]|nr:FAD-dependent oxidoreductase [Woeseiaceae bacterium]